MKKPILILLGLIVIVGAGYMYRSAIARLIANPATPRVSQSMPTPKMVEGEQEAITDASLSYAEYNPQVMDSTQNTRRVLFFYANWCPTCREAHADFVSKLTSLPQGVSVIRVNYNDSDTDDTEKALANKYGISYQHTFVEIDAEGNLLKKWNGGGVDELLTNIH